MRDGADLPKAELLVVPGVGAAAPAMDRLETRPPRRRPSSTGSGPGRPYLGICLGLQLLFEGSDEDGAETLGVLPGRTVRLTDAPTLPHIGWNQVERRRDHALFAGIADGADFYFVHSYAGVPHGRRRRSVDPGRDRAWPALRVGGRAGNVLGVQFHPERSGGNGLRLLANVVAGGRCRPA